MIATVRYAKSDVMAYLEKRFHISVKFIVKITQISNKVWAVVYTVAGNKKCSTFISVKTLQSQVLTALVDRAKTVDFTDESTATNAVTSTGHKCDAFQCGCKAFEHYAIALDGHPVCKHTVAYAKQFIGLYGIKGFAAYLQSNQSIAA